MNVLATALVFATAVVVVALARIGCWASASNVGVARGRPSGQTVAPLCLSNTRYPRVAR